MHSQKEPLNFRVHVFIPYMRIVNIMQDLGKFLFDYIKVVLGFTIEIIV